MWCFLWGLPDFDSLSCPSFNYFLCKDFLINVCEAFVQQIKLFSFHRTRFHQSAWQELNQNKASQRNQLLLLFWYSTVCNSNIVLLLLLLYVYSSTHTSRNTKWIGISLSTRGEIFFMSHIETRGKKTETINKNDSKRERWISKKVFLREWREPIIFFLFVDFNFTHTIIRVEIFF